MLETFLDAKREIDAQEKRVREETEKLLALHRARPARPVADYDLQTAGGARKLSSFFGDKNEMVLIHNMGKRCSYCTLWADGFSGFTSHFMDRAGFLLVNDDDVEIQKQTATERGWTFPMASSKGTTLFADMGMANNHADSHGDDAGVSILTRTPDGKIMQKTKADFGPGDIFCSIWSFMGMMDEKVNWEPKQKYFKGAANV